MKAHITKWIIGSLALACISWGSTAQADHYRHLDDQARIILQKSALLRREAVHYRHTPHFRHFIDDADDLRQAAVHVRVMVARRADLRHIRDDLDDLDASLRHLQRLVRAIERDARRGIGAPYCDTRHVWDLLDCIEHCVVEMEDDVVALSRLERRCAPVRPTPPTVYNPWHRVPSYYGGVYRMQRGGFSIQRGGFRIQLGF